MSSSIKKFLPVRRNSGSISSKPDVFSKRRKTITENDTEKESQIAAAFKIPPKQAVEVQQQVQRPPKKEHVSTSKANDENSGRRSLAIQQDSPAKASPVKAVGPPTPQTPVKSPSFVSASPGKSEPQCRTPVSSRARRMLEMSADVEIPDKQAAPFPMVPILTVHPVQPPPRESTPSVSKTEEYEDLLSSQAELPRKMKLLNDFFNSLDTVLNLLRMRHESPTMEKVRKSVEQITRRKLLDSHVGQMLTVWPQAFELHWARTEIESSVRAKASYFLVIDFPPASGPTAHELPPATAADSALVSEVGRGPDPGGSRIPPAGPSTPSRRGVGAAASSTTPARSAVRTVLSEAALFRRRISFRRKLEEIVRPHHAAFLALRGIKHVDPAAVCVWHADFDVEAIPDIEPTLLPPSPAAPSVLVSTDADLLARLRHRSSAPLSSSSSNVASSGPCPPLSKSEQALLSVLGRKEATPLLPAALSVKGTRAVVLSASGPSDALTTPPRTLSTTKGDASTDAQQRPAPDPAAPLPLELRGLSTALIDKVRQRERQAKEDASSGVAEARIRQTLIAKLPVLSDMLRSYFNTENRSSVFLNALVTRLVNTHREPISADQVRAQLDVLIEIVPEWCSKVQLDSGPVVFKINRSQNYALVRQKLTKSASSLQ